MAQSKGQICLVAQNPPDKDVGTEPDLSVADTTYIGTDRAERLRKPGGGGGGGATGILEGRVTHLEQRMGLVDTKLDTIIERLGKIPERSDMRGYLLLALALFVAIAALLIGAMGWLETRAGRVQPLAQGSAGAAPQPIVIQVPYPASERRTPPPQDPK
jgi:hypothetical protein